MEWIIGAIIAAVSIVGSGLFYYFKKEQGDLDDLVEFSTPIFMSLFLYAEKQGWIGEEKMAYCIKEASKFFPISISEEFISDIAQFLYDQYEKIIKNVLSFEDEAAETEVVATNEEV